jgi:hypothetical protein
MKIKNLNYNDFLIHRSEHSLIKIKIMGFILNICLKHNNDNESILLDLKDDKTLQEYLVKNLTISDESLSVLSLMMYLRSISNFKQINFSCICYYSDEDFDFSHLKVNLESILIKALNSIYEEQFLSFVSFENKKMQTSIDHIFVYLRKLNEIKALNDTLLQDASFPSLCYDEYIDENYLAYGLASVCREIIMIFENLEPFIKSLSLLGFRNNCLKVSLVGILFIS